MSGPLLVRVGATAKDLLDVATIDNGDGTATLKVALVSDAGQWTPYRSAARERTAIVKATGGTLKSFIVSVLSTHVGTLYVQAHNAATATAVSTGTLVMPLGPVSPGDVAPFDLDGALVCAAGIKIALSSTEDTYTDPGTDDGWWLALKA